MGGKGQGMADAESPPLDVGEVAAPRRKGGKRKLLFIILPILLLAGGGAALYATGMLDSLMGGGGGEGEHPAEVAEVHHEAPAPGIFFDLPDLLVNLSGTDRQVHYLKLSLSLELDSQADVAQIQRMMPRIVDGFQAFLRELRLEDLRGSAGLYRVREELLRRITLIVRPTPIRDLLLREMLVQR